MAKTPKIHFVIELYVIPPGSELLGRALAPLSENEFTTLEDGTVIVPRNALIRSSALLDMGVSELARALGGEYFRTVAKAKIKGVLPS